MARSRLSPTATAAEVDTALDQMLVNLALARVGVQDARHLFYAVRWKWCLTNAALRRSHQSLLGYGRLERASEADPVTWESVLLSSLALLEQTSPDISQMERVSMAGAMILAFDLYARGGDMVPLQKDQVVPPVPGQQGAARCWNKGGLAREMPESWQGLQIQARVVLKSLWTQSRNFGLTFEVSDTMICSEADPVTCPFHALDD